MKKLSNAQTSLLTGFIFLFLAVAIGAFGAHALKKMISPHLLITFETGNRYQFFHGFALLIIGLIELIKPQMMKIKMAMYSFSLGIMLFSFNCYLYAVTEIKIFAMIVPLGGILFLIGWASLIRQTFKSSNV